MLELERAGPVLDDTVSAGPLLVVNLAGRVLVFDLPEGK